ncbi:MAG: redoxin domain-containing protein [Thermoleophilia bacterium]|nr:redoxin domain-containing protein [Thermoleophilia bacterium]
MRDDLVPGNPFPDLRLPDHTARERSLSELADGQPLVLNFVRGWWCPKEQVRLRLLVSLQETIQREYGAIAVVTVDEPYVNGALRAGLGAGFPFLSDEDRAAATELDLVELTDAKHRPFLPFTFVLDSLLRIHGVWCGFWFSGNPTPEELRLALREITRREQPTFRPQRVWAAGGSAPADAGIDADVVWIREDAEGREIQRGAHDGPLPAVGDRLGESSVDARPWIVHAVESGVIHLRKGGEPDTSRNVRHGITAPPPGSL